jgi:hypothetical protein
VGLKGLCVIIIQRLPPLFHGLKMIYEGNSISKLQIQVATYIF